MSPSIIITTPTYSKSATTMNTPSEGDLAGVATPEDALILEHVIVTNKSPHPPHLAHTIIHELLFKQERIDATHTPVCPIQNQVLLPHAQLV